MPPPPPSDEGDFNSVFHGAQHMGHAKFDQVFDFLRTDSTATKKVSDLRVGLELSAEEQLSWLLEKLDDAGMSALAVNITTSEAEEAGIHVVRVIIPELMPVSFVHQVRYLAHPRLYDAPAAMGYPVRSEPQLNHYPQPFA